MRGGEIFDGLRHDFGKGLLRLALLQAGSQIEHARISNAREFRHETELLPETIGNEQDLPQCARLGE